MFSVKQFTSTSSLVSYRFKSKILFGISRNFCTGKVESNSIRLKPFPHLEILLLPRVWCDNREPWETSWTSSLQRHRSWQSQSQSVSATKYTCNYIWIFLPKLGTGRWSEIKLISVWCNDQMVSIRVWLPA